VSLALPWLSERETRLAITGWRESPRAAFDRLDRASGLNPLAPRPHLAAATIALEVEDPARALRELERVLELEPRTPFALAELAALASERGDRSGAQDLLQRAKTYAPRDAVVGFALKRVKSGRGIDVGQLNSSYRKAARAVIGRD
jgi:Flp pilus assembly protein TadD